MAPDDPLGYRIVVERLIAESLPRLRQMPIPSDSERCAVRSVTPIGAEGNLTKMTMIYDDGSASVFQVETALLRGGRGQLLDVFGRLVDSDPGNVAAPTWTVFSDDSSNPQIFEPWVTRAHAHGSPLVAQIIWTPDMGTRAQEAIENEMDEWDEKVFDRWLPSAAQALKFLHDFRRKVAGGRPLGGEYPNEPTFRARVEPVVRALRDMTGTASLEATAEKLGRNPRDLRRLCHQRTGLDWPSFVASVG